MPDERNAGTSEHDTSKNTDKRPASGDARQANFSDQPHSNQIKNRANSQQEERKQWGNNPDTWMVILTGILMFVGILTAGLFYEQFEEMRTQTSILGAQVKQAAEDSARATRQLEMQISAAQSQAVAARDSADAIQHQTVEEERPWIAVDVKPPTRFSFDDARKVGVNVNLPITLTNVGRSVARYVTIWSKLDLDGQWRLAQNRLCAQAKAPVNADAGYLLFPGQTASETMTASANATELARAIDKSPVENRAITVTVLVCVDYSTIVDSVHHQTRRVIGIAHVRPGGFLNAGFAPRVQYQGITLVPYFRGDFAD